MGLLQRSLWPISRIPEEDRTRWTRINGLPALTRLLHNVGQHEIYIRAIHVDLHEASYSQTLTDFPDVELRSHRYVSDPCPWVNTYISRPERRDK